MDGKLDTLDNENRVLKDKRTAIEKQKEETNSNKEDTTKTLEEKVILLRKED